MMLLLNCAVCGSEKMRFIIQQEASRLSKSLGLKSLLDKIPLTTIIC